MFLRQVTKIKFALLHPDRSSSPAVQHSIRNRKISIMSSIMREEHTLEAHGFYTVNISEI
jgi:hypothetical protein